jgi:hypothetical protein
MGGAFRLRGIKYGFLAAMTISRKITVEVPAGLHEKAQEASGTGIAPYSNTDKYRGMVGCSVAF